MRVSEILMGSMIGLVYAVGAVFAQTDAPAVHADNTFAFDLYGRYAAKEGNVFFSPYSISTALGMAYEGARGKTAEEMRAVLHFSSDDAARRAEVSALIGRLNVEDPLHELTTANALWAQKDFPFLQDYLHLVKTVYGGEARNMDFVADAENSRITINAWVAEQTKDRIKDLLEPENITALTRLIITNAVYFKGKWQEPFPKEETSSQPFYMTPDRQKSVDMMHRTGGHSYMESDAVQVLGLPYKGEDLVMLVLLPRSHDIAGLEKTLNAETLKSWREQMRKKPVDVSIPVFEFDARTELSQDLQAMGMAQAFRTEADFSGMTGKRDLFIGGVIHKAWVKVNEEGTEAAAATAVGMAMSIAHMDPPKPKIFRADHPFIFVIEESRTGQILFMGRVMEPLK